jgi:hypothetical protein
MKQYNKFIFLLVITVPFLFSSCEYREGKVKQLKGQWRFSIGDNMSWASPSFDDSKWDKVYAPSSWENEGYHDYNGYAWYRKVIRIAKKYDQSNLYLQLGQIDDVDEVYFNGVLIGNTGSFPPHFEGADEVRRRYFIPRELIKFNDDNLIAVRVYDQRDAGGIRNGDLGLYTNMISPVDVDLSGRWKFNINDSMAWKEANYNDSNWKTIKVPGYYEDQGYDGHDGFSWYRCRFDLPAQMRGKKLVMVLGKIDDIDQTYINGRFIGGLGTFYSTKDSIVTDDYYNENRGYYIPDDVILNDKNNVLAVRVFDSGEKGGIYSGHIGLITQENYVKYWETRKKERRW